jgi:hypothetical protein
MLRQALGIREACRLARKRTCGTGRACRARRRRNPSLVGFDQSIKEGRKALGDFFYGLEVAAVHVGDHTLSLSNNLFLPHRRHTRALL